MSHGLRLSAVVGERQFRQPLSPFTIRNYAAGLRQWEACGVSVLEDVSAASAQRFVESRLARNGLASVATHFAALLAVLSHLERTGRYSAAALTEVRRCAPDKPRRQQLSADYLTAEQLEVYCAGADERAAFLARLACYTGLRASELARLRWCDVDFAARTLHVTRGKTGGRRVPLCTPAIDLLRPRVSVGPVFTGPKQGGVCGDTLAAWVRIGRRGSGLRVTLTLCRHTRASWWVQAGVPLAKVAKFLGHSVAVCAEHYAGLADAYDPAVELGAAG